MESYRDVRSFSRTPWAVAIGLFCFAQMAAAQEELPSPTAQSAQPAPQASPSAATSEQPAGAAQGGMQELVVVGTRASLQSAIGRKKNSGTVVDSIVAEDIASFPDKNIGEALQRITGVQLNRDLGEGTSVSIRGVEPDLNRVEINGISLVSSGGGRSSDFREMASELVKSIDVFKGFTADMTEGGVGGTVSIETIKPLDLKKRLFSVTASEQYLDSTDTWKPRGNITVGDKFFDNRFGVLLNVTYDQNDTRGDFLRNTEWLRIADFDQSPEKTVANPDFAQYNDFASCGGIGDADDRTACETQFYDYSPSNPRYGLWIRNDKRTSGMLSLQYQATDELDVYVEGQYNRRQNRLIDNNLFVSASSIDRFDMTQPVTVDANHNVVDFYTAPDVVGTGGAYQSFGVQNRNFSYVQDSLYYSGGFHWKPTDDVNLSGMLVTSKGKTDNQTNLVGLNASVPSIHVSLDSQGSPAIQFPDGWDLQSPDIYLQGSTVNGPSIQYRPGYSQSKEDQGKWDLDWNTGWNFFNKLETGTQFRRTDLLSYTGGGRTETNGVVIPSANVTTNVVLGGQNVDGPTPTWTSEKYSQFLSTILQSTPGTFFDSGSHPNVPSSWPTPNFDPDVVGQFFDLSGFNTNNLYQAVGSDGQLYRQAPQYNIRETTGAAYFKANFESRILGMPLTGNVGVRYVNTKDVATGTNRISERTIDPDTGIATTTVVGTQIVSINSKYRDILPSVNANLEIADNLFARVGWAKVMARPKPLDLVPNSTCTFDLTSSGPSNGGTELDDCSAGNPDLKPYRADQYDLNISWYPNRDTLLSAAVFYKDIKSYILERTLVEGVDLFHDGRLFDVTQPINGAGAKTRGLELSAQTAFTFLPSPFDGLGGIVNYTYSDAKDVGLFNSLSGEELTFPGMSKNSYNLTLYYDKGPANVRFAYNARSKWLAAAAERSGNPRYRDGAAYLDGKATFRVPNTGLSFFVEGKNLTGETERASSGDIRLSELSYPGRRYFVGVSYKLD